MSHAASAFYPSPFEKAVVLTMDGVGEWATTSAAIGEGNQLEIFQEIHFPHSLGLLYSAVTYYTGFKVNSGEYKVMGLAPYGQPKYAQLILDHLIDLKPDGSFRLDMSYFDYCTGLTMTNERFAELFGEPVRAPDELLTPFHMDVAASIQAVLEEAVLRLTRSLASKTGARNLCLAGGVALNCVANGKVLRDGKFDNIWIQPAAGDAGGAVGAALAAFHQFKGEPRSVAPCGRHVRRVSRSGIFASRDRAKAGAAGARFAVLSEETMVEATAKALCRSTGRRLVPGADGIRPALARRALDPRRSRVRPPCRRTSISRSSIARAFAPSRRPCCARMSRDWFELDSRQPLHADRRRRQGRQATRHERARAGAVRDRQTERVALGNSGRHPCRLLRADPDRAVRTPIRASIGCCARSRR